MITFVIPVFNLNSLFLERCINSILSQRTNKDFEIIIIDDFSPVSIDEKRFLNKKIKIIKNSSNKGISYCLNLGINESKGRYLCWVSYDDFIFSSKTEIQYNYMNNLSLDLSYHSYIVSFEKNNLFNKENPEIIFAKNPKNGNFLIKKECFINGSTIMVKKDLFSKIGTFNEDLRFNQDWDFWIRALNSKDIRYFGINEILGVRTEHSSNLSNKIILNDKDSIIQKIKENKIMGI
jgi:glycosyltransferase involved in cell wall biosynthesis